MPQISFTPKNEHVYDRFSRLLLHEQLKRGKLTAPQFLDLVLDGWEDVEPGIEATRMVKYRVKIPCYHYNTGSADNYSYVAKHDFYEQEEAQKLCEKAREQFTMFKRYEKKEISFDRYQKWLSKFDCYEVEDGYITGLAEVIEFYPEQELEPENETE